MDALTHSSDVVGLSQTSEGFCFEHLDANEAEFIYDEIFRCRCYAPLDEPSGRHAPLILDVGANIGLFALWALQEWPSARVVCFEPLPPIVAVLKRNLHICGGHVTVKGIRQPRAVVVPIAVGSENDHADFHYYPWAPGESTRHPAEAARQRRIVEKAAVSKGLQVPKCDGAESIHRCPSRTLSAALKALSGSETNQIAPQVDLLKIDAEGDEEAVLLGLQAADWVRVQQVVVEVHDEHGRLQRILGLLRAGGLVRIEVQSQHPDISADGYLSFVPRNLKLFYVKAARETLGLQSSLAALPVKRGAPAIQSCQCRRRHTRKRTCGLGR